MERIAMCDMVIFFGGWLSAWVVSIAFAHHVGKLRERFAWMDAVERAIYERLRTGSDFVGHNEMVNYAIKRSGVEKVRQRRGDPSPNKGDQ